MSLDEFTNEVYPDLTSLDLLDAATFVELTSSVASLSSLADILRSTFLFGASLTKCLGLRFFNVIFLQQLRATRAYERRSTWWIYCFGIEPGLT